MSAQDKTVKITIVVDEASAAKAKRAIIEIKEEVDRLVKATQQLGGFLGGLGVSKVGAQAGSPGTSSGTQAQHGGAGSPMAGVTMAVSAGTVRGAGEIKKSTAEIVASFKSQKDALKGLVDAQAKEVERSVGLWGKLKRAMGMGGPQGTRGMGGGSVAGGGGAPGVSNPPGAAEPGGGAGRRGPPGFLQGVAQQLGLPVGLVGAGAAVGAGVGMAKFAIGSSFNNQVANIDYQLQMPMMGAQARAQVGDIFGGNAQAIRHGDMARVHAWTAMQSDERFKTVMRQDNLLELKRMKEHPTGAVDSILGGKGKAFVAGQVGEFFGGSLSGSQSAAAAPSKFDNFMDRVGRGFTRLSGAAAGMPSGLVEAGINASDQARDRDRAGALANGMYVGNKNTQVIEQELDRAQNLTATAQRAQELMIAKMREDPGYSERVNLTFGRSGADSALMRSVGQGGRDIFNKKTGEYFNSPGKLRAEAESMGRDPGEFGAAFGKLAQYGRGFGKHFRSILGPETGGLYNAAGIQGVGGQFGGFGNLLGGIQNRIGARGVDVTAGANVVDVGLNSMKSFLGGQTSGAGGGGLMDTLLSAAYTGGGTGADMYQAGVVREGMGRRERDAAGGIDALNKALNMSAAMKATPGAPWTTRNLLLGLGEGQLVDIMKNGKNMPKALLDNGVTAEMVQKYYTARVATTHARFGMSKAYGTQEQRDLIGQFRKTGDLSFLKNKSPEEVDKALNIMAAGGAGSGDTLKAHRGSLDILAAAQGIRVGATGAGGAGDTLSKKSLVAAANKAKGDLSSDEAKSQAEKGEGAEGGEYRKDFGNARAANKAANKQRAEALAAIGTGDAATAVVGVTKALDNFVKSIKAIVSDASSGKAAPKQQGPR